MGYEIMNNNNEEGRFQASDWSETKAGSKREVERLFKILTQGSLYRRHAPGGRVTVMAVNENSGEIVGGWMEV